MGKPGFPIPPSRESVGAGHTRTQGDGGNRVSPAPHPARGVGRATPARREMGETGFPHSPTRREGLGGPYTHAGRWGKPGFPSSPPGARVWRAGPYTLRWRNRVSPCPRPAGGCGRATPSRRGMGETGFPHSPPRREGLGGPHTHAGRWGKLGFPIPRPGGRGWAGHTLTQGDGGNWVSPYPHPVGGFGRATPSRREMAKPGFPIPPPGGRVCEGCALAQGCGKTGLPHPPTWRERGRGLRPRTGVWGNRVAPPLTQREGVGGRSPPRNNLFHPIGMRRSRIAG